MPLYHINKKILLLHRLNFIIIIGSDIFSSVIVECQFDSSYGKCNGSQLILSVPVSKTMVLLDGVPVN